VTGRTSAALLVAALCAAPSIARADCPEGTPQAACVLHEEGVVLLTSARYEEAATKFRGAIAAAPSARSYLGYSQSVEGHGKLALAYETMLVAQRLSNEELAGDGAKDPAKIGRAERIKYKLSDLAGRVGFVWLRLPEGVPPQRLVSIHREGEGDLPSPLGRWITVAPGQQLLIASLDDGTQLQVVAKVAAGSQSSLVVPIAAPRPAQPPRPQQQASSQQQPPYQQPPYQQPSPYQPPPPGVRPIQSLYQPPPPPAAQPFPSAAVAVGMTILAPGPELGGERLGSGVGLFGLYERRVSKSLGLSFRADYVSHPTDGTIDASVSGFELMTLAGVRTMTRSLHARLEGGLTLSTIEASTFAGSSSQTNVHPVIGLGGGLHLGRVRLHASVLYAANSGSAADTPQMPIRFMGVIGVDLWRR
jgi:hypothetical protein